MEQQLFTLDQYNKRHYNWPVVFEEQKKSGLSIMKFCDLHHIAYSGFYSNRNKLKAGGKQDINKNSESKPHFMPVAITSKKQPPAVSFKLDGHEISCTPEVLNLIMEALLCY